MNPEEVKAHWQSWADEHGTSIRATTMTETIKRLEIEALYRVLKDLPEGTTVLEAGCGNGVNLIELKKRLPSFTFSGFDYVPEMISAALAQVAEGIIFSVADVLDLALLQNCPYGYDVVFTDRLIINLNTWELQQKAIKALAGRIRPGGLLVMIENFRHPRERQSRLLGHLGMKSRGFPPFNLFLDEDEYCDFCSSSLGLNLAHFECFASLHDLMLYVMVPALIGETQNYEHPYDHPLVKIATELSIKAPEIGFGNIGQNQLWGWKKPA